MYIICSRDHVEASATVRARLVPQVQVVTLVQSEAHADDLLPPEFCELMLEESSEALRFCLKDSSQCPTSELELLSDVQPPADTSPRTSLPQLKTVEIRATTEGTLLHKAGLCPASQDFLSFETRP